MLDKQKVIKVLDATGWNKAATAKKLRVSKYGMEQIFDHYNLKEYRLGYMLGEIKQGGACSTLADICEELEARFGSAVCATITTGQVQRVWEALDNV